MSDVRSFPAREFTALDGLAGRTVFWNRDRNWSLFQPYEKYGIAIIKRGQPFDPAELTDEEMHALHAQRRLQEERQ